MLLPSPPRHLTALIKGAISPRTPHLQSAPAYMKTNNNDSNGGFLCGVTGADCPSGDWRQAYANYLVQYHRFYEESGIPITHVGFLNEPDISVYYASMQSTGTQAADFLKILAPTIRRSGLKTKIACCDATGWRQAEDILSELQQAGAEDTLSVVTAHGYQSEPNNPLTTTKPTWQTEWADLSGGWTALWDDVGQVGEGIQWANKIQEAFVRGNCSAFLHWIGVENSTGNSMLIRINGDNVEPSKRLWAFAQFSRFAKPGAVRIGATSSNELLHVSAFQNTNGVVAVQVMNNGHVDYDVGVTVSGAGPNAGSVTPWLTNNAHNLTALAEVKAKGGSFSGLVPARSMVSFVMNG